jgi:hypothetical protein
VTLFFLKEKKGQSVNNFFKFIIIKYLDLIIEFRILKYIKILKQKKIKKFPSFFKNAFKT